MPVYLITCEKMEDNIFSRFHFTKFLIKAMSKMGMNYFSIFKIRCFEIMLIK